MVRPKRDGYSVCMSGACKHMAQDSYVGVKDYLDPSSATKYRDIWFSYVLTVTVGLHAHLTGKQTAPLFGFCVALLVIDQYRYATSHVLPRSSVYDLGWVGLSSSIRAGESQRRVPEPTPHLSTPPLRLPLET